LGASRKNEIVKFIMDKIDFNKTISSGRLNYKKKLLMILDVFSFALLITFIVYILSLTILKQNLFERTYVLLFVAMTSIGLSMLKWNYSMRIVPLRTEKSKKENRQIIEKFIDSKVLTYRFHNNDFIQTISNDGFLWMKMELNFIIQEKIIYVNINYSDARTIWPSFLRIKNYRNEIIKELNASTQQISIVLRSSVTQ